METMSGWRFGTWILGWWSNLTNSYFSEGWLNHQPVYPYLCYIYVISMLYLCYWYYNHYHWYYNHYHYIIPFLFPGNHLNVDITGVWMFFRDTQVTLEEWSCWSFSGEIPSKIGLKNRPNIYPLVDVYISMERSTIFNGKIHYFYGHFQ